MQLTTANMLSTRYKMLLAMLSVIGIALVLLSTSLYGAGLSPDSVGYIGTARNMAKGIGVISFDGTPLVVQPPLYPAVLAIADFAFKIDPLTSAPVMNAFLFGLILYVTGLLLFKHLTSSVAFSLLGVAVILFSRPIQGVAVMAWSEPLFVFFVLVFLLHLEKFLANKDATSFATLSLSAALACLTRYIGVTLILSGMLALLFLRRDNLKVRLSSCVLFVLISVLPVGMWAFRNYAVSATLFGARASSVYTLPQNLELTFNTLLAWYFPSRISDRRSLLMLISVSVGFLAGFTAKGNLTKLRIAYSRIGAIALFVATYTAFLIYASTTTAFDRIDNRLLSPIYVPATLLMLIVAENLLDPFRGRFSPKVVSGLLVGAIGLWLIYYPFRDTVSDTINRMSHGAGGYNSKYWRESALVQYLQQHPLETGHEVFSNNPDGLYILANMASQMSPAKTPYNSNDRIGEIATVTGTWPKNGEGYLVWFDATRPYLFTIDELQTIADMQLTTRLSDGTIYTVSRRQ